MPVKMMRGPIPEVLGAGLFKSRSSETARPMEISTRGRIDEGAVRPPCLGHLAAEHEHGGVHRRVVTQVGRDDVFEQLIRDVPVIDALRGGVEADRDRVPKQGPEHMGRECHRRDAGQGPCRSAASRASRPAATTQTR